MKSIDDIKEIIQYDNFDWDYAIKVTEIPEDIIRKFQDKFNNWYDVFYYQDLSESFIEEFSDKLN